jgi:hypothetical protein
LAAARNLCSKVCGRTVFCSSNLEIETMTGSLFPVFRKRGHERAPILIFFGTAATLAIYQKNVRNRDPLVISRVPISLIDLGKFKPTRVFPYFLYIFGKIAASRLDIGTFSSCWQMLSWFGAAWELIPISPKFPSSEHF